VGLHTYPPMKMEQTGCSGTSTYKIQTWGNYPEEGIPHNTYKRFVYYPCFVYFISCRML